MTAATQGYQKHAGESNVLPNPPAVTSKGMTKADENTGSDLRKRTTAQMDRAIEIQADRKAEPKNVAKPKPQPMNAYRDESNVMTRCADFCHDYCSCSEDCCYCIVGTAAIGTVVYMYPEISTCYDLFSECIEDCYKTVVCRLDPDRYACKSALGALYGF